MQTANRGYARLKAAGKDGWMGDESEYDSFKKAILASLRRSGAPTSGVLLELGCGAGNLTLWFASMGYEAHGVDITPAAIEWAQEKNDTAAARADFRVEDAAEILSFADGFFDLVIDGHCLHWIAGDDRIRVLAAVHRVLREDGFFLVNSQCSEPKGLSQKANEGMVWEPERRVLINRHGVVGAYFGTPESILSEVTLAGFRVLNWEVTTDHGGDEIHIEAARAAMP